MKTPLGLLAANHALQSRPINWTPCVRAAKLLSSNSWLCLLPVKAYFLRLHTIANTYHML